MESESLTPWRYRPRSNIVFAVAMAGAAVVTLVAGVQSGELVRFLPWVVAVAAAGWAAFVRPAVIVDAEGVTLVNPLRTIQVPWPALINVTTRYAMTLHTPTGKYAAWAAPGPGRYAVRDATNSDVLAVARRGETIALGDLPTAPSGLAAFQVRRRWQVLVESDELLAGEADTTPVRVQVDWPLVTVLGAAVILGLVTALI